MYVNFHVCMIKTKLWPYAIRINCVQMLLNCKTKRDIHVHVHASSFYTMIIHMYFYYFNIFRTKFRVQMNKADNISGSKAIDSLINFETVKVSRITMTKIV